MTQPTFLLNVALNASRQITGVFAGDMLAAHAQGCAFVKANAMAGVSAPYDIVITTNRGYPLDQNLYQSVKGMSAAAQIVREGGDIIDRRRVRGRAARPRALRRAAARGRLAAGGAGLDRAAGLTARRTSGRCRSRRKSSSRPRCTSTATT